LEFAAQAPCRNYNGVYGMGKKIYTINGKMFIIDDETGKVKEVIIKDTNISFNDMEEIIKFLAQNQKD
jgi:hypothetical protein